MCEQRYREHAMHQQQQDKLYKPKTKPLVGISSCLTGHRLRYDGKDKFNQLIHDLIAPHVTLLPICPEAAVGLGIPRPPIRLIETTQGIEAVGRNNPDINVTEALVNFGETLGKAHSNLCGYIFQSRSPSCGFHTTPIYDQQGVQVKLGSGLTAQSLQTKRPDLIIRNDIDLLTPESIADFLEALHQKSQSL